jgi:DnaA-homolog protein
MNRCAMPATSSAMHQLPLPIGHDPVRSFASFVVGSNALAVTQLDELSRMHRPQGAAPPPVYLWGPSGCGKTHLLLSFAARLREQGESVDVFDATSALPWPVNGPWDAIILDGCDDYDAARQQAAFALFVEASARDARIAAAGRLPPVDLPLRDDLRTRLGWGHVIALHPLSDGDLATVLRDEAHRRGLVLTDEVGAYILSHYSRDLANLMKLLERADVFALSRQRALTVPLLRQMHAEQGEPEPDE